MRIELESDKVQLPGHVPTSKPEVLGTSQQTSEDTIEATSNELKKELEQAPESEKEATNTALSITLLCLHPKGGTCCHVCDRRLGIITCGFCGQDLRTLAILESLESLDLTNIDSIRDTCSPGGEESHSTREGETARPRILVCPKSRLCHACMIAFGWSTCSYCTLDFSKLSEFSLVEKSTNLDKNPGKEPDDYAKDKDDPWKDISHNVEYFDINGELMGSIPWAGPFDLTNAMLNARKGLKKSPAFQMITQVITSIDNRGRIYQPGERSGLSSIIGNADISLHAKTTSIEIQSKNIIKSISDVVAYYPSIHLGGQILVLKEPFSIIAHHMQALELCYDPSGHTGIFLTFMRESIFKDWVREEEARNAKDLCTFQMLWLLFKPGDTVYAEVDGDLLAFVIVSVEPPDGILSSSKVSNQWYEMRVWNLDFDGRYVGRRVRTLYIEHFEGERDIRTLKLIPCRFVDNQDGDTTRTKLQDLGKQWYELLPGRAIQYSGMTKGKEARQVRRRSKPINRSQIFHANISNKS